MPSIRKTQAAYIAGFIDGDGHIGLVRRTRRSTAREYIYVRPIVQIGQAKRLPLDWIADAVGAGGVSLHGQRDFYNLRFHAGTLRWLLPAIYPHLVLKRRQAEIVMEFLSLSAKWRNGRKLTGHELARREALRTECACLNRSAPERHIPTLLREVS